MKYKMNGYLLALVMIVSTFALSLPNQTATAASEEGELTEEDLEELDLNTVSNLDEMLDYYGLSEGDITSHQSIKHQSTAFINAYNEEEDTYFNFYVVDDSIEYQSIQEKLDNGNATFTLYSQNKEYLLKSELTETGEMVEEDVASEENENTGDFQVQASKPDGVNTAAIKWACIFSSYIACVGVAGAAGAGGTLVSGPFGAAAGFAGGLACRYVFQTAVEEFGSKDAACKVLT